MLVTAAIFQWFIKNRAKPIITCTTLRKAKAKFNNNVTFRNLLHQVSLANSIRRRCLFSKNPICIHPRTQPNLTNRNVWILKDTLQTIKAKDQSKCCNNQPMISTCKVHLIIIQEQLSSCLQENF